MNILFLFFFFVLGTIVGSFLNCVIYRLAKKESFLGGRSYCPHCHHALSWEDLVPLVSFLFLRGKCRYCGKTISLQYPLVELGTGFIFSSLAWQKLPSLLNYPPSFYLPHFLFLLLISCFLVVIFVYDLKHLLISDRVIYPAILISGAWSLISNVWRPQDFLSNVFLSALGAGGFFLALVLITRGKGMGVGDVKLGFLMGLILGFPDIVVAIFMSFFLGAVIGLLLIIRGEKDLKSEIPFAPFLVTGTFISLFWAEQIVNLYFRLTTWPVFFP